MNAADGLALVNYGNTTPTTDRTGLPWVRLNADGSPDGLYVYYQGNWENVLIDADLPGNATAVQAVAGAQADTVTVTFTSPTETIPILYYGIQAFIGTDYLGNMVIAGINQTDCYWSLAAAGLVSPQDSIANVQFKVRVFNKNGYGDWSDLSNAITVGDNTDIIPT